MKKTHKKILAAAMGAFCVMTASAQTSFYNGDLLVGFTIGTSGTDMIYDLGSATNLVNGKQWNLATALAAASLQNSLATVQWGVIGSTGPSAGNASLNGTRFTYSTGAAGLNPVNGKNTWSVISSSTSTISVNAITNNAAGSYGTVAATDPGNYSWYYQVAGGGTGNTVYASHGGATANTVGLTSNPFYQTDANNSTPINLGSFTLATGGILTYNVASTAPPAPQIVSITRTSTTSTIFFTTTNGLYTYTLYYTNSAGLGTSVTNWPASPTTVTGNGLTNSISDTTTDPYRFYRVGVH
jgi:hypothetical protein